MASTYLSKTFGSSGNRKTFTLSLWVKVSNFSLDMAFLTYFSDVNNFGKFGMNGNSGNLAIFNRTGGVFDVNIVSNAVSRDVNGWYHFVASVDTTQATASDRVKLYVNGEQVTSFASSTYPSQNADLQFNTTSLSTIGSWNSSQYFNGSMSHFHYTDGTAYDASAFGQTDANGVWTIKTSPSVTYGTNGFFILKDGNSVTDQSGNGNNWSVGGGTLTNTEDSPSNVFCTFNPLIYHPSNSTFSNGNTRVVGGTPEWRQQGCTIGIAENQGKYYWEMKGVSGADFNGLVGIKDIFYANQGNFNYPLGYGSNGGYGISYGKGGELYENAVPATSSWGATYTAGDIISVAFDADNMNIYFAKNGVWQNSGVPTSGATGTGAVNVATVSGGENIWLPFVTTHAGGWDCNFGNGYFGTTAVASAGTNASGIGIFEYDVPTGYTALSTKGLNL